MECELQELEEVLRSAFLFNTSKREWLELHNLVLGCTPMEALRTGRIAEVISFLRGIKLI